MLGQQSPPTVEKMARYMYLHVHRYTSSFQLPLPTLISPFLTCALPIFLSNNSSPYHSFPYLPPSLHFCNKFFLFLRLSLYQSFYYPSSLFTPYNVLQHHFFLFFNKIFPHSQYFLSTSIFHPPSLPVLFFPTFISFHSPHSSFFLPFFFHLFSLSWTLNFLPQSFLPPVSPNYF